MSDDFLRQIYKLVEQEINAQDANGKTALMLAICIDSLEIVQALVDKGANLDVQNERGTALILAARTGRLEIMRALIDRGANLDVQNAHGETALMLAANNGHTEIVQALIDRGANLDVQNVYGKTALMLATNNGHTEIVRALEQGITVERLVDFIRSRPSQNSAVPGGPKVA